MNIRNLLAFPLYFGYMIKYCQAVIMLGVYISGETSLKNGAIIKGMCSIYDSHIDGPVTIYDNCTISNTKI